MKICLLALIICALFGGQTTLDSGVLAPPRQGLVALHWPDLTNLEASVREQLTTSRASLTATVKDPRVPDARLSEAYGSLGQIYHAYSLIASARECYLNANRLQPKDFRWIYLLAKLDQQEGRFDDAIRGYQAARTLQPDYVAAPVNLGNIFLQLDRLDDAAESFTAALAIEKDNPAAYYGLGQVTMSRRNYADAVKYFEKTLALVPDANRVHYSLAMAYRGLGDSEKARAHLAQQGLVGIRVSDPLVDRLQDLVAGERLFLSRGKLAFDAQRFAEAAAEFRKAVAAAPDSVTARVNLGAALTQLGDLTGAVEQFQEAIRIQPGNANAHYNLAVLFARQNKHAEAVTQLRSVLTINPRDHTARVLLARQLVKSEHLDEALAEFSRVVEADPNNEEALIEQVKLLYRQRQFKQALDAAEKSQAQFPHKGRTVVLLAYLLSTSPELQVRDGARALDLAEQVYKATGAVQHGALVAIALAELGRCNEASDWQRRAIAAAEQQPKAELLNKLRADLKLYEGAQSCRPAADPSLTALQLFEIN